MKRVGGFLALAWLWSGGCCLNADKCTEVDGRATKDGAVDIATVPEPKEAGTTRDVGEHSDGMADAERECTANKLCTGDLKPFCSEIGKCEGCAGEPKRCPEGRRVCLATGACVECDTSKDCTGDELKPICAASKTCGVCSSDSQCATRNAGDGPGICLPEGRCATAAEVLYVQVQPACKNGITSDAGTAASPFCEPQDALRSALVSGKRVVVLQGPEPLSPFIVEGNNTPFVILGRNAVINPRLATPFDRPGVEVRSGHLSLRDVTISGGRGLGVVAGPGTTLEMDRVKIQNNEKGGVRIDRASFSISNTLIANNGANVDSEPFGGLLIRLDNPLQAPRTLKHVTVANNRQVGLYCTGPIDDAFGVLAYGNIDPQIHNLCGPKALACCISAPANFTDDFVPRAGDNTCVDKVARADSTPFDLLGKMRTGDGDCGAIERPQL